MLILTTNKEKVRKMILDITNKYRNCTFRTTDLSVKELYSFILADTYLGIDAMLHDVNIALDRAIERANRLYKEDKFQSYINDTKDIEIHW